MRKSLIIHAHTCTGHTHNIMMEGGLLGGFSRVPEISFAFDKRQKEDEFYVRPQLVGPAVSHNNNMASITLTLPLSIPQSARFELELEIGRLAERWYLQHAAELATSLPVMAPPVRLDAPFGFTVDKFGGSSAFRAATGGDDAEGLHSFRAEAALSAAGSASAHGRGGQCFNCGSDAHILRECPEVWTAHRDFKETLYNTDRHTHGAARHCSASRMPRLPRRSHTTAGARRSSNQQIAGRLWQQRAVPRPLL